MALSKLKQGFIAGAATAALSLGTAFGVANDAHAQQAPQASQISLPQQQAQTKVLDYRRERAEVVRTAAAYGAQQDALTVLYFVNANNKAQFDEVRSAIKESGANVTKLVLGTGNEGIFVYVSGGPYGPAVEPVNGSIKDPLKSRIQEAQNQQRTLVSRADLSTAPALAATRD